MRPMTKYLEYNNKKLDKLKRDKEYITVLQNNLNRIRFSKKMKINYLLKIFIMNFKEFLILLFIYWNKE